MKITVGKRGLQIKKIVFYKSISYHHSRHAYFLAHLAHSAKVSFWESAVSVVRRRVSCVVCRVSSVNIFKHLLLLNYLAESLENLHTASLREGTQTIQSGILNLSILWKIWPVLGIYPLALIWTSPQKLLVRIT